MSTPTQLDPSHAANELVRALRGHGQDFTIADASARSGLPLRDAEQGLHALVREYRGHLRVTDDGELLFRFTHGFTKPWEVPTRAKQFAHAVGNAMLGALRFIVRAWITLVLVGYTVIFVAIFVGLVFARGSSSDSRDRGHSSSFGLTYLFFRIVSDALLWTFHPFSPVAISRRKRSNDTWNGRQRHQPPQPENQPAFYDRVNQFFFRSARSRSRPSANRTSFAGRDSSAERSYWFVRRDARDRPSA
jgi:hypothetical protein